ncbi:site-specific DNA-methyltransferase [Candidatus Methylobacter favarea]|nr:site-specific DNA-methyltransferase [Candidatus Methylobacter favarea]
MADNYDDYSREELIRELRLRDRRPRFGLVWERKEIEHEKAVNDDFVTLDFDPALSCGEAPYRNLIIEGDNFDALRYLRMTHAGKVKCIYIDPPYNTGNRDFIYNDRFVDKDDAYRHSKWLEFMNRRLLLARELLAEEGVIFVSIDDGEGANLRLLMDSIFGENNFLACIAWEKRYTRSNNAKLFYSLKDWIIVFRTSPAVATMKEARTAKADANFSNPDNDPSGAWMTCSYVNPATKEKRPNLVYPIFSPKEIEIKHPTHAWKYSMTEHERHKAENRLWWGNNNDAMYPRLKLYLSETKGMVPIDLWSYKDSGTTDDGGNEIKDIFGEAVFDNPKPTQLIERILRIATTPGDIVLDFFAGSGTTAHAVMRLNAEDDGNRRFILVSCAEATESEPDKNLCRDVCAERARRVSLGYTNKKGEAVTGMGGGFAYFRTQRHPTETLFNSIQHEAIWTALQLIHAETVSLFEPNALIQRLEYGNTTVLYLPKINDAVLNGMKSLIAKGSILVIYSWQPGLLRQHFEDDRISFLPIPQFLVDRFGNRGIA